MNFLGSIGLDIAVLTAIVGVSEYFKRLDKNEKLKKLYVLFPLVLSIGVGFFMSSPITGKAVIKNTFVYFGISSLAYNIIKNTILTGSSTATPSQPTPQVNDANSGAPVTGIDPNKK